ncbi:hypothetical protein RclHR1_39580001 [Rhizophagus clarus]|uniref:Uncharacterized protein n=1 Tax=Rhizophagus clarus TaxID=94130 RepID=A0A2Z6RR72_9GLOM|nr:hypothetical protein RclHR1_39580001 [Rhizophagus clarus]
MSQSTSTSTYVTICDDTLCAANTVNCSSMGVCTFTANPKHIVPLLPAAKFTKEDVKQVDWTSTFECLNCDIANNETSISSSKVKAHKVHLLIEEIPTIEQMKKSFLNLYDGWKYSSCGLEDETFDHVWICDEHQSLLLKIKNNTIDLLLSLLIEYNPDITDYSALLTLNIWTISTDPDNFTFVDLIKGFIPLELTQILNLWISRKQLLLVIIEIRQYIYEQTFKEIWIRRCSFIKEFERSLVIEN